MKENECKQVQKLIGLFLVKLNIHTACGPEDVPCLETSLQRNHITGQQEISKRMIIDSNTAYDRKIKK